MIWFQNINPNIKRITNNPSTLNLCEGENVRVKTLQLLKNNLSVSLISLYVRRILLDCLREKWMFGIKDWGLQDEESVLCNSST